MNDKTKRILLELSGEIVISTNFLERLVNAGSTMIFQEGFESLDKRFKKMSTPEDLLEETILCCAYSEVLRRLVEVPE